MNPVCPVVVGSLGGRTFACRRRAGHSGEHSPLSDHEYRQLAQRRVDPEFQERVRRRVHDDQAILRRLIDADYQEVSMARVRMKMFVQEIAQTTWGGRIKLQVVTRGEDNKKWASATPSGSLEATIRNELALEVFEKPGEEFYIDIYPVPKDKQGQEGME